MCAVFWRSMTDRPYPFNFLERGVHMQEDMLVQPNYLGKIENYRFAGIDSTHVGAIKSVADYYQIPLSTSWIYGMTGIAFLHVLGDNLIEPNGGPPESEIFRLARNLGVEIEGIHVTAEGDEFERLQAVAWEKAKHAIDAKQPVFAKNIDQPNQITVIHGYDQIGYYTYSWHTGHEHSEDVKPWNLLGLSHCTCIHCIKNRAASQAVETNGLISLHWATKAEAKDDHASLKEALEMVIQFNEMGSYEWGGKTYLVGSKAYGRWFDAIERNELDKYFFSLFIEILREARQQVIIFLTEIKERIQGLNFKLINDLMDTYREVASGYEKLGDTYSYTEPPGQELINREQCKVILQEISIFEEKAFRSTKELYKSL